MKGKWLIAVSLFSYKYVKDMGIERSVKSRPILIEDAILKLHGVIGTSGLLIDTAGSDLATETTLDLVKTAVDSIALEDFATETTLAAIEAVTSSITVNPNGSLDVNITGSGVLGTPTKTTYAASDTIALGAKSVTFITSSDFSGSILGDTAQADSVYTFSDTDTLGAIAFIITTGTIEVLVIR